MSQMNRHNPSSSRAQKQEQRLKAIEVRFKKTRGLMRALRVKEETKDLQTEIAYAMDTIDRHGFRFFPNHYIHDEVVRLSKMVEELASHPSTVITRRHAASIYAAA